MPWIASTNLLQKLADGSENRAAAPAIVSHVELLTSLPDTDGQGDPIHWHNLGALEHTQCRAAAALAQEAFG